MGQNIYLNMGYTNNSGIIENWGKLNMSKQMPMFKQSKHSSAGKSTFRIQSKRIRAGKSIFRLSR